MFFGASILSFTEYIYICIAEVVWVVVRRCRQRKATRLNKSRRNKAVIFMYNFGETGALQMPRNRNNRVSPIRSTDSRNDITFLSVR